MVVRCWQFVVGACGIGRGKFVVLLVQDREGCRKVSSALTSYDATFL